MLPSCEYRCCFGQIYQHIRIGLWVFTSPSVTICINATTIENWKTNCFKNFNFKINVGGSIGGKRINQLFYADDVCLLSLSSEGMQNILDICAIYAIEHDLIFNETKTMYMCFSYRGLALVESVLKLSTVMAHLLVLWNSLNTWGLSLIWTIVIQMSSFKWQHSTNKCSYVIT